MNKIHVYQVTNRFSKYNNAINILVKINFHKPLFYHSERVYLFSLKPVKLNFK